MRPTVSKTYSRVGGTVTQPLLIAPGRFNAQSANSAEPSRLINVSRADPWIGYELGRRLIRAASGLALKLTGLPTGLKEPLPSIPAARPVSGGRGTTTAPSPDTTALYWSEFGR